MADNYLNFHHLCQYEINGEDFETEYRHRDSEILVMAPHGGRIEPYTEPLAKMIAGDDLSFYIFRGMKRSGNSVLHITSHCFDEPVAVNAASHAQRVIAIHGAKSRGKDSLMVGGSDMPRCSEMRTCLKDAGFNVMAPTKKMAAKHPMNICNRGKSGKGIQLELSHRLRMMLKHDDQRRRCFVDVVRAVLVHAGR